MTTYTFTTSGSTGVPKKFTVDDDFMAARAARRTSALNAVLAGITKLFIDIQEENIITKSYRSWAETNGVKLLRSPGTLAGTIDLFEREQPEVIVSAPSGLMNYVHANRLYRFKTAVGTGMLMDARQADAIEAGLADAAVTVYGMSEVGMVTWATGDQVRLEPGCVGTVCDDAQVEFEGDLMKVKTETMISGYTDPALTARYFHDGWFWPGDKGRRRDDGLIVLTGRARQGV